MFKIKLIQYTLVLVAISALYSCGGGGGETPASDASPPNTGEILATGNYAINGQSWSYEQLRMANREGGYTYAQLFKQSDNVARPVIVITRPYAGIDWTGEEVDTRWANDYSAYLANGGLGAMCAPDVDGPDYQAGVSSVTCYTKESLETLGGQALIFLLNDFNVLLVFGRFYAGGDIANDVEDAVAGLRFLATRTEFDTNRIGIFGGSWGGFQALYATLKAPENVKPAVSIPMYPVTDLSQLVSFVNNDLPALVSPPVLVKYNNFYDPYLRRAYAQVGQPPNDDFSGYQFNDLSNLISSPVLLPHDDGDTILPATLSHIFADANPSWVEGFWYKRSDTPPWETVITEHGEITQGIMVPAIYTFTTSHLLTQLAGANQNLLVVYAEQDIQDFFNNINTYQTELRDVTWLVPRLIEMCDDRIVMNDTTSGTPVPPMPGKQFVAQWLNSTWGTSLTVATVQAFLMDNGLPSPP